METKTIYFETQGEGNTDATLAAANQRAKELDIKTVVVASTRGYTAVKAVDVFRDMKVVIVTQAYGGIEPNTNPFVDDNRKIVESKGGKILTTTAAFGGINGVFQLLQDMSRPPSPTNTPVPSPVPGDIIARTLRIISSGFKVAVEVTVMAADSGLVRCDEEIIAVAGSGRGADTALVVQPANSNRFFECKIKEIICKPRR